MPMISTVSKYRLGRFELRLGERLLLDESRPIALRPRALDVLIALAQREGGLATIDELLRSVWPGAVVEKNALEAQISALRKVLGQGAIETVARKGYRLALAVTAVEDVLLDQQLPQPTNSFIGRGKELQELEQLLSRARHVTIVGTGGCGKTRIALRASSIARRRYSGGVCFVELASLSNPSLILGKLANALAVPERLGELLIDSIVEKLVASNRTLLVFDNAEHLLESCGRLVEELLARASELSVLVTSREALGLSDEVVYRIPSLGVPPDSRSATKASLSDCESAQLFMDRARVARPGFSLEEQDASALASICRRLDGIPLAIELAAPRVNSMSLAEIDRRLDRLFSLLTSSSTELLPRQRTLRSLIDWSYELLSPREQLLLCRVSVFVGGWSLAAAKRVGSGQGIEGPEVRELLVSLVGKNLVLSEGDDRFGLLETIRRYALDRLGEDGIERQLRADLHLSYFVVFMNEASVEMHGEHQAAWLNRLELEHDNLRSALAWSIGEGDDVISGMTIGGSLWRFWLIRGYFDEGRSWLSRLLAADTGAAPSTPRGNVLTGAGQLAISQADLGPARTYFEGAMAVREATGDRRGVGSALSNLGSLALRVPDTTLARDYFERALAVGEEIGDQLGISNRCIWLGNMSESVGDYPAAIAMYQRSLAIKVELGEQLGQGVTLCNMGVVFGHQGDHLEAMRSLIRSLQIFRSLRDTLWVAGTIEEMAPNAEALGEHEHAATLWGAAARLRGKIGESILSYDTERHTASFEKARDAAPDQEAFMAAWHRGHSMDWEQTVAYATDTGGAWQHA